jgi:hypothetical protein
LRALYLYPHPHPPLLLPRTLRNPPSSPASDRVLESPPSSFSPFSCISRGTTGYGPRVALAVFPPSLLFAGPANSSSPSSSADSASISQGPRQLAEGAQGQGAGAQDPHAALSSYITHGALGGIGARAEGGDVGVGAGWGCEALGGSLCLRGGEWGFLISFFLSFCSSHLLSFFFFRSLSHLQTTLTPVLFQTHPRLFLNCHPIHPPLHLRPPHADPRGHASVARVLAPPVSTSLPSTLVTNQERRARETRTRRSWCGPWQASGYRFGRGRLSHATSVLGGSFGRAGGGISRSTSISTSLAPVPGPSASQEQERSQEPKQERERERERTAVPRSASGMFSARAAGNIFTRLAGPRGARAMGKEKEKRGCEERDPSITRSTKA